MYATLGLLKATKAALVPVFQGHASSATNANAYTFNTVAIGAASPSRTVYVVVAAEAAGSIDVVTGMTIGGVTATIHSAVTTSELSCAVASAVVPSGTTATVVVTFSDGGDNCTIGVWTTNALSVADDNNSRSGGNDATTNVRVAAGGFILNVAAGRENIPMSWTQASVRFEVQPGSDQARHSGADFVATVADTSKNINVGSSGNDLLLLTVSFK
jgi:hypothetical protein